MLLFIDFLMLLVTACMVVAIMQLSSLTARLAGIFVVMSATLIASVELLQLIGILTVRWAYPALHTLLFFYCYLLWKARGRPNFFPSLRGFNFLLVVNNFRKWLRKNPAVAWLGSGVTLLYLVGAVLVLVIPPNTNDSMNVHLARVGFWLQHGSLAPWSTPYIWQLIYPGNAQFIMFWTILGTGSDHFVGFIQFFSVLISILLVYGLARYFEQPRRSALMAALIWACFPIVILQSTSSQSDMLLCASMQAALYFFLIGIKQHSRGALFLSALAVGVGTGTKQLAFFFIAGLGLIALLRLFIKPKVSLKFMAGWAAGCALAILLIGSYFYQQNFRIYGNPFGEPTVVQAQVGGAGDHSLIDNLHYNFVRFGYDFVDFSGLPWQLKELGYQAKAATLGRLLGNWFPDLLSNRATQVPTVTFTFDRIPDLTEDIAWYGPLGFILLPLAFGRALRRCIKQKNMELAGVLMAAVLYGFCVIAFRIGWTPYQGRYFLMPFSLVAPFLLPSGSLRKIWSALLVFLSLLVLSTTALSNGSKPLVGDSLIYALNNRYHIYESSTPGRLLISSLTTFFPSDYSVVDMSRIDMMTISTNYLRGIARYVDANIPEGNSLGLLVDKGVVMYPFFGEHFGRRIVPIYPGTLIEDCDWIFSNNLDFVLVYDFALPEGTQIPTCLSRQVAFEYFTLYSVQER